MKVHLFSSVLVPRNAEPSIFDSPFLTSQEEANGLLRKINFDWQFNKRGRIKLIFSESDTDLDRVRNRIIVTLNAYKDVDFSKIAVNQYRLPGLDIVNSLPEKQRERLQLQPVIDEIRPPVLELLQVIWGEAGKRFSITTERRVYIRRAWKSATVTMRQGFRGKVSVEKLRELQQQAYMKHLKAIDDYEKELAEKKAPVPRALANAARVEQAALSGIESIELDHEKFNPIERSEALQQALMSDSLNETMGKFAFNRMTGPEIHCTLSLIQAIRETAGAYSANTYTMNRDDYLRRMGYPVEGMDRRKKSKALSRIEKTFRTLGKKSFALFAPLRQGGKVYAEYQLFAFATLEVEERDKSGKVIFEIGAWRWSGFDALRVLSNDDMPFRSIPVRPFAYIAEHADFRRHDALMRLVAEVLLSKSFGTKQTKWDLSLYNLDSGKGTSADLAARDRQILVEALQRYGDGLVKIERGKLTFDPKE